MNSQISNSDLSVIKKSHFKIQVKIFNLVSSLPLAKQEASEA